MADDQTIRELQTTDDYMAQAISFLTGRVENMEQRLDTLQTMHENTVIIVGIWGILFSIIIAIIFIKLQYQIRQKNKKIRELQYNESKDGLDPY